MKLKSIIHHNSDVQPFIYHNILQSIIKPNKGTILTLIPKDVVVEERKHYVVIEIFKSKKGVNKDIISMIYLQPIHKITSSTLIYQHTTYPMILRLTNHGHWGIIKIREKYTFLWDYIV